MKIGTPWRNSRTCGQGNIPKTFWKGRTVFHQGSRIRMHLNSQFSHGKLGDNGKTPSKYWGKNNFQLRILTLPSYQVKVGKKYFQMCKVSKNVPSSALLGHNRRICFTKTRGTNQEERIMGTRRLGLHHKTEVKKIAKMMLNRKSKLATMPQALRTASSFWSKSEGSREISSSRWNRVPNGNKYSGEQICTADGTFGGILG